MNWTSIDKYAIQCEPWTIGKSYVHGIPAYTLWEGDRMVQIFKTAEEAKERAEAMTEREVESV